jgi:hypothetical protein
VKDSEKEAKFLIEHRKVTDHKIEMQQAKAKEIALQNLPLKPCVSAPFF